MKIWILNVLNTLKKCLPIKLNIHIYWSSPREKEVNEPEMKNKKSIAWMRWDGKEDPPTATRTTTTHWTKRVVFLFFNIRPRCNLREHIWTVTDHRSAWLPVFPFLKKKKREKKETKIPTLDSYTHYYNYKHLFPKHDHRRKEKKEKRKKKRGSIVQISPRGTHNYNRMQTYLYSTLYSSFLFRSFSLSLSHSLSLSLSHTDTHTHRPRNPRIPMLSCSDLCWKSVLVQCRFGESRRF